MTITNRLQLLSFLAKSCAYEGKKTIEDVKSFLTENEIELKDTSGKAFDIDALWKKTVTITADAGEVIDVVPVEEAPPADDPAVGKTGGVVPDRKAIKSFAIRSEANVAKKSYNAKAAQGTTRFDDADKAEAFNAAARLNIAACNGIYDYSQKANDMAIVGKDGSELVNTLGGSLVADTYNNELLYLTEMFGVAGRVANVKELTGGNNIFARKTGIISMAHVSQGNAITATDNTYDNVQLIPKQVACLLLESRQLLDNAAINMGDDIAKSVVEAQLKREDTDYTIGDGTATYGGHVGLVAALPSSAYLTAVGANWGAQTAAYFYAGMGLVENVDFSRCSFIMSRQAFIQIIMRLSDSRNNGTGGADIQGTLVKGKQHQGEAWGFPVYFSQTMPTVTAAASRFAYFGDFMGGSMLGRRKGLQIDSSKDFKFNTNQLAYRGVADIAVNVHGDGRGSTYGPIVGFQNS